MDNFFDRLQVNDAGDKFLDLTDAESEHYQGAGDAIVFVNDKGMVEAIDYIHDIAENGAEAATRKADNHGRAYYAMCGSYQLSEITPMTERMMVHRVHRLVAENFDY